MMMATKPDYVCIREEQLQGQGRAIERLNAELEYKKEKLDDLKKDNEKMQDTLDEIKQSVNEIVLTSKQDDDKLKDIISTLNTRITALETRNHTLSWVIGIGFTALSSLLGALAFFMTHLH